MNVVDGGQSEPARAAGPLPEDIMAGNITAGVLRVTSHDGFENGSQESDFKPLTREQALLWRSTQPSLSAWAVVRVQWLVGLGLAVAAVLLTQRLSMGWSVLYGAAAAAMPASLMAWGLTSSRLAKSVSGQVEAVFLNFVVWEGAKILLTVALLWVAPRMVPELNWLALLTGFVLVLKVYWFGFFIQTRR